MHYVLLRREQCKSRSSMPSGSGPCRWLARLELAGTVHNYLRRGFTLAGNILSGSIVLVEC